MVASKNAEWPVTLADVIFWFHLWRVCNDGGRSAGAATTTANNPVAPNRNKW